MGGKTSKSIHCPTYVHFLHKHVTREFQSRLRQTKSNSTKVFCDVKIENCDKFHTITAAIFSQKQRERIWNLTSVITVVQFKWRLTAYSQQYWSSTQGHSRTTPAGCVQAKHFTLPFIVAGQVCLQPTWMGCTHGYYRQERRGWTAASWVAAQQGEERKHVGSAEDIVEDEWFCASASLCQVCFERNLPLQGPSHWLATRGEVGVGVVSTHCWLISGAIGSSNKWPGGLDERRAHAVGHQ